MKEAEKVVRRLTSPVGHVDGGHFLQVCRASSFHSQRGMNSRGFCGWSGRSTSRPQVRHVVQDTQDSSDDVMLNT